jgi:hypothetical protein
MELFCRISCGTTEIAAGASTMRSGARDAPCTTISVSATATGSSAASTVAVLPASTVTWVSVGRYPSQRKTITWGPAGTRRSVYLPSGAVIVLWPVPWTLTDTLDSGDPSPVLVTVPVTVPVS